MYALLQKFVGYRQHYFCEDRNTAVALNVHLKLERNAFTPPREFQIICATLNVATESLTHTDTHLPNE